jgi:predicted heme/steroid binding protein
MARISTYPEISIPGLEDLLIGTDVGNLDQTKNFRLGDIIESLIGPMFVPYLGATGDVNLGAFGITANSFIKAGGLSSQFLKADGSVDSNSYTPQSRFITINGIGYDLSANRSWSIGSIESLSTAGTSGSATFTEGILNIPEYQEQGSYITQLSGEATGSGPGSAAVTLSNSAVISKVLTGFNTIGGSIAATDTILQAFGKAQSQINSLVSGVSFRGTWNASTNTPALASGVGTGGHYYVVSVAGSTTLNGVSSWSVGDWVVFNGVSSAWQRVPNTQLVSSVNGFTGAVSLTSTDVGAAPSSRTITINGVSFDLTSNRSWTVGNLRSDQVYSNPSWISTLDWGKVTGRPSTLAGYGILNAVQNNTTVTINGVGYDLSANRVWSVGTVTSISVTGPLTGGTITGSGSIGITQAGPTTSGYLSSADWNSFNDKIASISALAPIVYSSGVISISQAGASSDGYLSSADWNAFNNKQDAIVNPITGTGTSGTLPIFTSTGSISDSIISYSGTTLSVGYSSTTGNSFVLSNTGLTAYSYSIVMNNFAILRTTTHSYSEGAIIDSIGGNQVRRVFPNGNTVFGVSTVDNGSKLSLYGTLYVDDVPSATVNTGKFLVSDNGVLKYRTGSQLFSDIGSSREITINGIAQDLSVNRSWSVGTVQSVSITAPVGFTVAGSPVTSSGVIALAFASGYSLPTISSQSSWDSAFNNMIVSAAVTGTTTKTLTLNQQDGGTVSVSWVESGGGGTPGGSNTQVQFNNSGSFGGSANFAWDNTNSVLSVASTNGAMLVLNGLTSSNSYIDFQSSGVRQWRVGNTATPSNLTINDANNNEILNITQSGVFSFDFPTGAQISINTSSDGVTINPVGSVNAFVSFSSGTFRVGRLSSGIFVVRNVSTDLFSITTGGQVNIGGNFTSTNNRLQVNGNVAIGYTSASPTNGLSVSGRVLVGTNTDNGVDALQVNGSLIATSVKVSGGTASQFLKANGTVDSNTYLTANQTITLSGDITGTGSTAITTTIANNSVSLAKMAQVATARVLGRVTAGTGNVESLTGTQLTTLVDVFTSALKGAVPAPGSVGSTRFLREDGTWVVPSGGGGGITGSGTTNAIPKFTGSTAIGNSSIIDTTDQTYIRSGINSSSPPFPYSATGSYKTMIGGGSGYNLAVGNNGGFWLQLDSRDDSGTFSNLMVRAGQEVTISASGSTVGQMSFSVFGTSTALVRSVINNVVRFQVGGSLVESFVSLQSTSFIKSGATSSDVLYGDGSTKKITSGTAAPSGGADGDIYLQYV